MSNERPTEWTQDEHGNLDGEWWDRWIPGPPALRLSVTNWRGHAAKGWRWEVLAVTGGTSSFPLKSMCHSDPLPTREEAQAVAEGWVAEWAAGLVGAVGDGAADGLRRELDYYKGREKHFATVLGVAEGGRYANDWDSRIQRLVNEAAALRSEVRYLRAYGNKDCTKMAEDAMGRRELEGDEA